MDEKPKKVARAGSVMIRINNNFYEVPDTFLFKSHDNKDCYISGIKNTHSNPFKPNYITTVKFIEEGRYEDVSSYIIEGFLNFKYKKIVIDNEEYDIPIEEYAECKEELYKLNKHDKRGLNQIKKKYETKKFKQ